MGFLTHCVKVIKTHTLEIAALILVIKPLMKKSYINEMPQMFTMENHCLTNA